MLKRLIAPVKNTWVYKHKWKFIIGVPVISYGANWQWEEYNASQYLQKVLETALIEGELPVEKSPIKTVHIILNPVSNGGYARQTYERFAQPVLDCAGYHVVMHKTEYVKHERDIASEIPAGDLIVIAGGDSTVQNVLTGLNRRTDFESFKNIPIGIIPLGATNSVWHQFSNQKVATWTNPCSRGMRVIESAQMIVNGNTNSADVLALTNDDDKTIYTLTGLRWGKYFDMEERLSSYWYFPSKALKRRIAYINAYFRGELEEMRSAEISYARVIPKAEIDENARQKEEFKQRHQAALRKQQFNFFNKRTIPNENHPDTQDYLEALSLKLNDLKNTLIRDFFEVDIKINHKSPDHEVSIQFENEFNPKNLWNMLIPMTEDPLSTRRLDFGRCALIDAENSSMADFTFEPLKGTDQFVGDEEKKDFSFYIDGEAYIPCKLKGKLLVNHTKIFANNP